MMTAKQFIEKLESTFNVKAIHPNYETLNGWNPLILELNQAHLFRFISRYGYSGNWRSAKYSVVGNQITFYATVGDDIARML